MIKFALLIISLLFAAGCVTTEGTGYSKNRDAFRTPTHDVN